jgi:hypothetical protein
LANRYKGNPLALFMYHVMKNKPNNNFKKKLGVVSIGKN